MRSVAQAGSPTRLVNGVAKTAVMPIEGIKALDLKKLIVKLKELYLCNRSHFIACGHDHLLTECERLVAKEISHLRVNVMRVEKLENGSEKNFYRFKLIDKAAFPSAINRLCAEVFCELSETGIKEPVA